MLAAAEGMMDEVLMEKALSGVPQALGDSVSGSITTFETFFASYTEALIVLSVAIGVLVAFNGRYLLSPVIFLIGATPGGFFLYVIVKTIFAGYKMEFIVSIVAFVIGMLLFGWLCVSLLYDLGVFLLGAIFGGILAAIFSVYFLYKISPQESNLVFYFTCAFLGALFGLLSLSYRGVMIPITTSFVGAYGTVRGIAFFLGNYPDPINFQPTGAEPWRSAYIAVLCLLGFMGAFSQTRTRTVSQKQEEESLLNDEEEGNSRVYETSRYQKPDHLRGKYAATPPRKPNFDDAEDV